MSKPFNQSINQLGLKPFFYVFRHVQIKYQHFTFKMKTILLQKKSIGVHKRSQMEIFTLITDYDMNSMNNFINFNVISKTNICTLGHGNWWFYCGQHYSNTPIF